VSDASRAVEPPLVLRDLLAQVDADPVWRSVVEEVLDPQSGACGHLAVMHEPYLSLILDGSKTVESRFSQMQVAPYRQIRRGDLVLFKLLSGPVTAIACVAEADFYVLDSTAWARLRQRFEPMLAAQGESFWTDRQNARYASLIRLGEVRPVSPIPVAKRDRRGWVVLSHRGARIHPDQLDLIDDDESATPQRPAQDQAPFARARDSQMKLGFE
jgi:hypothetical protein